MGRFILLPFAVHPDVPELPNAVVPLMPIVGPDETALTTRQNVIDLYWRYLGRAPENEAAITGRVGRPLFDVELEIATSQEAFEHAIGGPPHPSPAPVPANPTGLTDWDKRVGLMIADALASDLGMAGPPAAAWIVFAVQAHIEDAGGDPARSEGAKRNNPLNLSDAGGTITWGGQVGRYFDRFASFDSLESGCRACAQNYAAATYRNVQAAFRAGDPLELAGAIQDSPWDADHYGYRLVQHVTDALAPPI